MSKDKDHSGRHGMEREDTTQRAFLIFAENLPMAKCYPAKLLLFGEYSLLMGSQALCLPLPELSGCWEVRDHSTPPDHPLVVEWVEYLEESVSSFIDIGALRDFLGTHVFKSTIPVGYGLGSSGALCAAVYDRFAKDSSAEIEVLKTRFGLMEQFFHGSSSGLDPLTSYLAQPLLVRGKSIEVVEPGYRDLFQRRVFLLDSGRSRLTGPLVAHFMDQTEEEGFGRMCRQQLAPAVDEAIAAFLGGKVELFMPAWRRISTLQLEYFSRMIPQDIHELWERGLQTSAFSIKLCGAGGGGFFLGCLEQPGEVPPELDGWHILFPVF